MNTKPDALNDDASSPGRGAVERADHDLYLRLCASGALFDTIGDGMIIADANRRILCCNEQARTLLGMDLPYITPGEWLTRYTCLLADARPPDFPEELPLIRALHGDEVTQQEMHISGAGISNTWLCVTARPVFTDQGEFDWTYIILRDINLRRWSQEQQQLHDHALRYADDGIVVIDTRSLPREFSSVNDGFCRMTGYSRSELMAQPVGEVFLAILGEASQVQLREGLREATGVYVDEFHCTRKDGSHFWARVSVSPIHDRGGTLTHNIAIVTDITPLVEVREELRHTLDKLESANAHMRFNLRAAAKVQRTMLPSERLEMPGVQAAWGFQPTEDLSGDILNLFRLDDSHIGMYILDVSGHGVAPAMLSVTVSHLLHPFYGATSLVYEHQGNPPTYSVASPGKVATRLAQRIHWDMQGGQFFTFVYAVLNCCTGELRYACAGHPTPILADGNEARHLPGTGDLPIGLVEVDYRDRSEILAPGTRLVFFSDGIFEAMTPKQELFGRERLLHAAQETKNLPAQKAVDAILERVETWREGERLSDDASLMLVDFLGCDHEK